MWSLAERIGACWRPRSAAAQWAALLLSLVALAAEAGALRRVAPSACAPRADDYTFLWWADGFRGRSAEGRWLRCVGSGRYVVVVDVERVRIAHLGPVARPLPYGEAVAQDNRVFAGLRGAELRLSIAADGKEYRCVRGGRQRAHSGPRLIESGRFVQRADVTDLVFEDARGRRLGVDARFEVVGWPDRLTLLLTARPSRAMLGAGHCFGRVGGGYAFDGTNHIGAAHAPELEPETLTLELWVYLPQGPRATRDQPWLACKNANEWAEGNYGLMLIRGVPEAFLNIGGGRRNVHRVSAAARHGRGALTRERWHYLAMSYDGAALRLYVDGRELGRQAIGKKRVPGTGGLAIGRRQDNSGDGYHFRGAVDEVRIYRRALSAAEIKAHATAPESVKPGPSLVREWTFDPKGRALTQRPSQEWTNASMSVSVAVGGETFSNRVAAEPGQAWTRGTPKTAAVSLALDAGGARAARDPAPIAVAAVAIPGGQARRVDYDALRGWHRVNLDGIVPQGEHNDAIERVRVKLANPTRQEQPVRLLFEKNGSGIRVRGMSAVTGMSPMLRDADGYPLGIPVQISKNWHRQQGRELAHQGVWLHGFTMLRLPARSHTELELALVYAHWGGVAAASHAQLCLIGWGSNQLWDQSALGAWGESICYEPDQAQGACAVLDVRPLMVHQVNQDRPRKWGWTNNVGGADFFRYVDAGGRRQFPARMKAAYHRYGPNLTEVTYAGRSQDARLEHRATVSIFRTDDVTRGVYRLRLDVREPTDFRRMVFFQIGADSYSCTRERKMALGSEEGLTREWDTRWGGPAYRTPPMECTGRVPWLSLHEAVSRDRSKAGAWANRGIVIRRWDARLGGRKARPWAAEHGVKAGGTDTSTVDIVPPPGLRRLLAGDYLEATFEHVVVPQFARDYYGPNANLRAALKTGQNTWRMIHREAVGNDLAVEVSHGALQRVRPTRLRAEADRAAFTITGGLGYVPVTIGGLTAHRAPVLEIREGDGAWRPIDQSVHGRDFWQADHVAETRTWDITYTVPLDSPGDVRTPRQFRFRLGRTGESETGGR